MKIRQAPALCICLLLIYNSTLAQISVQLPKISISNRNGTITSTGALSDFDNALVIVMVEPVNCTQCPGYLQKLADYWSKQTAVQKPKLIFIDVSRTYSADNLKRYDKVLKSADVFFSTNGELRNLFTDFNNPMVFILDKNQQVVFSHQQQPVDASKYFDLATAVQRGIIKADNLHFDDTWWPADPKKSSYYRKIERTPDGFFIRDYYTNGTVQMAGKATMLHPEKKTGKFEWYDSAGRKNLEASYTNNLLEGPRTAWFANGKKSFEENYAGNLQHGSYTSNYENGRLYAKGDFERGKRVGKWILYHENGKKKAEGIYRNGRLEGVVKTWHSNGALYFEGSYNGGELSKNHDAALKHANGRDVVVRSGDATSYKETFLDDKGSVWLIKEKRDSYYDLSTFFENGKPAARFTIKNDRMYDKLITWYSSGQKLFELNLYNNYPIGKAMAWWENGQVRERVDFDKGLFEYYDMEGKSVSTPTKKVLNLKKDLQLNTSEYLDTHNIIDRSVKTYLGEQWP